MLFISCQKEVTRIVVIDSYFCEERAFSAVNGGDYILPCPKSMKGRQFHGAKVLRLLKVNHWEDIEFYPVTVFNEKGEQSVKSWERAIHYARNLNANIIITAAGIPVEAEGAAILNGAWGRFQPFVWAASGSIGPGIDRDDKLWPQRFVPRSHLLLFGDYFVSQYDQKKIYNESLLNQDRIDYYISTEQVDNLSGSSAAVALGANKILVTCQKDILEKQKLLLCLNPSEKSIHLSGREEKEL